MPLERWGAEWVRRTAAVPTEIGRATGMNSVLYGGGLGGGKATLPLLRCHCSQGRGECFILFFLLDTCVPPVISQVERAEPDWWMNTVLLACTGS